MPSNLLEDETRDVFGRALEATEGDVYLMDPSATVLRALVRYGAAAESLPTVNVVARQGLLKDVMDDFLVAADAADLIADGKLTLRELDQQVDNTLLVTQEALYAIVTATDAAGALASDDAGFIGEAYETYAQVWEDSAEFNLRTPPLSRVRTTLSDDVGEDVRADFDTVLESLETARGNGDGLDEVTISLLVAAKNEALLYDISKWGEDVGIASKATFSRTKTRLEDIGIIDTEKVPIDVGRPRLRLKFGDERLRDADSSELASVAQSIIG
ncbi:MAG: transcriptional regulator TbsP [Halobaculum sp.]